MSADTMKGTSVRMRGLTAPLVSSFLLIGACNADGSDGADGFGGAADSGGRSGSGGRTEGIGGRKPTSGGAASSGGAEPSPTGGRGGSTGGGRSSGGAASGGEAGAPGAGGASEQGPEPRWIAFPVGGGNETPLMLARSDGSVDAVSVFDDLSGFSDPSWSADGKSLVFVEYFCCGFSNGAYAVDVDEHEIGSPTLIHEPLSSGATIRYAGYSPTGEYLLGRFVDSSFSARYALRHRDAEPSEWTFVTTAAPWGPSDTDPAWSPDGRSLLLAQGHGQTGVSVYRVEITSEDIVSSEILSIPPGAGEELLELVWSKNSEAFAIGGTHSLRLGYRDRTALLSISEGPGDAQGFGEGGASGVDRIPEYGPHVPLEFSPNSERLLYASYEAPYSGSMRLWGVDLESNASVEKVLLLEGADTSDLQLWGAVWPNNEEIYLSADIEVSGRHDVLRIDWASGRVKTRARLPDGHASHGFAWLPRGVVYLTQDANYVPNRLSFVDHDEPADHASTLFEFGEDAVPGWSNFLGAPSPRVGGFFTAYELDLTSGYPSNARLWHFTPEGTLELLAGPLEGSGAFTDPGAFDRREEQFAFTYDIDGDSFYELGVSRRMNGEWGEPIVAAELLDVYGGTPLRLVWQP